MHYMYAPLDLSERQVLIYHCLYKKASFLDMTVKITSSQIVTGIKIIDLTERIVNLEIKRMIELGHLKLVERGVKGKYSTYKIIKENEKVGNLSVGNRYVNGNLKDSNFNAYTDNGVIDEYIDGSLIVDLFKDKEKDKDIIYKDLAFIDLYYVKVTEEEYEKLVKVANNNTNLVHDKMLGLETGIVNKNKKYLGYKSHYMTLRNWINSENKKATTGIVGSKNNKVNSSICNNQSNYSSGREIL